MRKKHGLGGALSACAHQSIAERSYEPVITAIARLLDAGKADGSIRVDAEPGDFLLVRRTVEGELFGLAKALGLGVTPYSPLASGVLSGKYSRENRSPEGSGRGPLAKAQLDGTNAFEVLDVLHGLAKELDASVAAVALAWVRQQLASIAVPLTQSGTQINGVGSASYRRQV